MATQGGGFTAGRHGVFVAMLLGAALAMSGCQKPADQPDVGENAGQSAGQNEGVLNVADAAIAGNNPQMALKMSQAVLANDPHNLEALYHEAAAYYAVGRCQDSIAAYKVALGIAPKSSQAEVGIGRCLLKRNAAEAELAFQAAVQDDPTNAVAFNDLGIARDLEGKYAAARSPYETSLLLSPGQLATEVNLGMSLALSGDATDALQYLGPLATGAEATPKIRQDYAAALVAAGRDGDARQVLSVDLAPDQVDRLMDVFKTEIFAPQPVADQPAPSPPTEATAPIMPVTMAPEVGSPVVEGTPPPAIVTVAPGAQTPDAAVNDRISR